MAFSNSDQKDPLAALGGLKALGGLGYLGGGFLGGCLNTDDGSGQQHSLNTEIKLEPVACDINYTLTVWSVDEDLGFPSSTLSNTQWSAGAPDYVRDRLSSKPVIDLLTDPINEFISSAETPDASSELTRSVLTCVIGLYRLNCKLQADVLTTELMGKQSADVVIETKARGRTEAFMLKNIHSDLMWEEKLKMNLIALISQLFEPDEQTEQSAS